MKKKIKLIPLLYSNHSSSVGLYDIVFFYHTDQLKMNYSKSVLVCKYINITQELAFYYYLSV